MRPKLIAAGIVLMAALSMSGCRKGGFGWLGPQPEHGHGRYEGVGIYGPGVAWTRMVAAQQTKETPAAQVIDDQAIIVVVDSATGEMRACGDLSGYCIGMNPWKTPLVSSQIPPIKLTEHMKKAQDGPPPESAAPESAAPSAPQ